MFQKIYHHLEQINANTRQQQASLEQAGAHAGKISRQLEELNSAIRLLEKQPPRSSSPRVIGFSLAGIGLVLLAILTIYTVRLSAATDAARDRSVASIESCGLANNRAQAIAQKTVTLDTRTMKLDSLVTQQAQTIVELKKLNVSAIRSVFYLQRELYHQRQQAAAQAVAR